MQVHLSSCFLFNFLTWTPILGTPETEMSGWPFPHLDNRLLIRTGFIPIRNCQVYFPQCSYKPIHSRFTLPTQFKGAMLTFPDLTGFTFSSPSNLNSKSFQELMYLHAFFSHILICIPWPLLYMRIIECIYAYAIYSLSKYFYWKFNSMTAVI